MFYFDETQNIFLDLNFYSSGFGGICLRVVLHTWSLNIFAYVDGRQVTCLSLMWTQGARPLAVWAELLSKFLLRTNFGFRCFWIFNNTKTKKNCKNKSTIYLTPYIILTTFPCELVSLCGMNHNAVTFNISRRTQYWRIKAWERI